MRKRDYQNYFVVFGYHSLRVKRLKYKFIVTMKYDTIYCEISRMYFISRSVRNLLFFILILQIFSVSGFSTEGKSRFLLDYLYFISVNGFVSGKIPTCSQCGNSKEKSKKVQGNFLNSGKFVLRSFSSTKFYNYIHNKLSYHRLLVNKL